MGNARARFLHQTEHHALYVDMLEFQSLLKSEVNLTVDSNFTIYFGGSNLPAESWMVPWEVACVVPSYAGPRSGVAYTRPDGTWRE